MAQSIGVLTAYIGAMLADIIRRRNDLFPTGNDRKTVSKTLQRTTFILLPLYFLLLFLMINRYAIGYMAQTDGEADFKTLTTWLAIIESGFGVYVGQIVYGLFREK
jgi:preprotein translocase subunit SecG